MIYKETNDSSSSRDCKPFDSYSYFFEDPGEVNVNRKWEKFNKTVTFQTSTTLPPARASKNEFLQPGCSYEIFVRDANGSFIQQDYTVPGKLIR